MATNLQRHTGRQGCADPVPRRVVHHVIDCPTPKDQARGVATTRCRGKSRLDLYSSRRLGLPHGGRQLSSICDGRCQGMAKVRGRREEEDVDGAGIGLGTSTVTDTTMYPGSGLSGEITPLLLLVSCISME